MTVLLYSWQRNIPVVILILQQIVLVGSLSWKDLHSESVPSLGLFTEPTLRDVSSRDNSLTLSWTVDGVTGTNLMSVEMFVKRRSKIGDIVWQPLSQLSFIHPVTGNSTHAIRFSRDLNGVSGEAYRANVTLISGTKNTTSSVDVMKEPYGPKSVNLNSVTTANINAVSAKVGYGRIDAYFGYFEKPDTRSGGTFGLKHLVSPSFTEAAVPLNITLPFNLVPGETYRIVIAFSSWDRRSGILTGSNYKTVAPVAPVIEEVNLLSNSSVRVAWMLSTGIADTFIVTVNGQKHVIKGGNHITSAGRYSANIDGLKNEPVYFITVAAESNRTQGHASFSFTYDNIDGFFPNDRERNITPGVGAKPQPDDVNGKNGNVIAPWVISGILTLIVLCVAVILGLTIRKLRRLQSTIKINDNPQNQSVYETIRTSYLHPI